MQNQEEKAAKKEKQLFWRKCPICAQEFKDFLPLIKHIEEHRRRESQGVKIELGAEDYLRKKIAREFFPSIRGAEADKRASGRASKRKFAAEAKVLLLAVADWLREALTTLPAINMFLTSDVKVAEQLFGFASCLHDNFREQREYLLKH